jgi:tetratricopeptide (TPR) repeat protein
MPERDANDLQKNIECLLNEASSYQKVGQFRDAETLVSQARRLAKGNLRASAEIDLFWAMSLIEQNKREQALQALSAMLIKYGGWFKNPGGQYLYRLVQLQRAFSLMHLERNHEARPLLEEAESFQFDGEVQSAIHCQLGRCYHELSLYTLAKPQFERAHALGVTEDWQVVFHYYYGYTLYELKDFQLAKREFILCLQSGASGPAPSMRYSMLAAASRKLGEHDEARFYEKKAEEVP